MEIRLARVYRKPSGTDGLRILVDRIWPRGLKKDEAGVDWWPKEIAPSTELRRWFGHDPAKWEEFRKLYFRELEDQPELIARLREMAGGRRVTLVYGARDEEHNNALALKEYLEKQR